MMEILAGDELRLKKKHPCGSDSWKVIRAGADCRLECMGCGHQVMLRRKQAEKMIRELYRDGKQLL